MNPLAELLGIEEECPTQKCRKCGVSKSLNDFSINSYGSQKFHRKICKKCRDSQIDSKIIAIRKIWGRGGRIKQIRPPEGTPCQCCSTPMTYGMGMDGMCFDHDPIKKEFRGWICKKCNTSFGLHGDSLDGIKKLAIYLEERQ